MATLAFLGILGVMGAVSGGVAARNQQKYIKDQVCQIGEKINTYNTTMKTLSQELNLENYVEMNKISAINQEIVSINNEIASQHKSFKQKYTLTLVLGSLFIIGVIFILSVKKFVLKSSTISKIGK